MVVRKQVEYATKMLVKQQVKKQAKVVEILAK